MPLPLGCDGQQIYHLGGEERDLVKTQLLLGTLYVVKIKRKSNILTLRSLINIVVDKEINK